MKRTTIKKLIPKNLIKISGYNMTVNFETCVDGPEAGVFVRIFKNNIKISEINLGINGCSSTLQDTFINCYSLQSDDIKNMIPKDLFFIIHKLRTIIRTDNFKIFNVKFFQKNQYIIHLNNKKNKIEEEINYIS